MAKYRIKVETTNCINANGKQVSENKVITYHIVNGGISDVVKDMLAYQNTFVELNQIKQPVGSVRTLMLSRDNSSHVYEIGACYTCIGNQLADSVVNMVTMFQIADRIG